MTEAGLLDRPDDAWEQLADAGLVITTTIDITAQEAARRAVVAAASRLLDDAHVTDLARSLIPSYAGMEARIRQARQ